jgi:SAM-dependent methyltransferase
VSELTESATAAEEHLRGKRKLSRSANLYLWYEDGTRLVAGTGATESRIDATPQILDVLALCDGRRSEDEIIDTLRWAGMGPAPKELAARSIVDRLIKAGLLLPPGGADDPAATWWNDDSYGYARPEIHRTMLQDKVRTDAFEAALNEVVKPGSTVIDMGTGTGILAMFAAKAGATEVHAIEFTSIIERARQVAAENGLGERIVFHQGDAQDLAKTLEVRADVIVSEWLGYFVFSDGMWPAVVECRERCLNPGGVLVPSAVDLFLAPLDDREVEGPNYWNTTPYGFDFTSLMEDELRYTQIRKVNAEGLLATPERVQQIDCATAGPVLSTDVTAEFTCARDGELNAFCGHFSAQLSPSVVLDTAPGLPETHWQQQVFAIQPVQVRKGDRITLRFRGVEAPYDNRLVRMHLEGTVRGPDGERSFKSTYDQ